LSRSLKNRQTFFIFVEVEEAMDLLRAKFHKEKDLLAAHGLIEALGLLNTKSAAAEIMQVVKIVRPTLSTKAEVRK